jgi:hypothetical protein
MIEDGRLVFQIAVDVLVDAPALQKECEQAGQSIIEFVGTRTRDFMNFGTIKDPALEYRLVSGPTLKAP